MKDTPAPQNQPDETIQLFLQAIKNNQGVAHVTAIVSEVAQKQLEQNLSDFSQTIGEANLDAIEIMSSELDRIKSESQTMHGVLQRLKVALALDIEQTEDGIVSYRQAINNLERYGSIIPSDADIALFNSKLKRSRAWSLLWQSFLRLMIHQIQNKLQGK